jgi:hypothetical protein
MIIDSLMRAEPRIYNRNPEGIVKNVSIDNQLLNLVRNRKIPEDLKTKSQRFINTLISTSKEKYAEIIDTFYDHHEFDPTLFKKDDDINSNISSHPSIIWNLKRLKK